MASDNTLVIKINGSAKDFLDELDKVKKSTKDLEKVLSKTAKVSAAAFAGFAAAIAVVIKSFADYETALVGLGKTSNLEGKKLENFGKQFQKLASVIPISTNELLGIGQAAAQLGVTGEANLLKFTETVAKLGVATDLSGEQAAVALTRILNTSGEAVDSIDVLGSVIVRLGNEFAATESEIVHAATSVSRATAVFGTSSAEAVALAAALKSMGIQAQIGGSVVGKSFLKIQKAIDGGGKKMQLLSKLTGIAGEDLKRTFQEDAAGVFEAFIEGLGEVEGGTTGMFEALEGLGLKGDEVNKVLPVLAKNSDLLARALSTAADETTKVTALNNEAAAAFDTLNSRAKLVSNNFTTLTTKIGEQLAPAATELLEVINELLKGLSNMDKSTFENIAAFLKWGAIITGTIATLAAFALGVLQVSAGVTAFGLAFIPATVTASAFWIAVTGPIGIAIIGLAAVTVGIVALNRAADAGNALPENLKDINTELDKLQRKRKQLDAPIRLGGDPNAVRQIDEQIERLEDLRQQKLRTDKEFGTGSLLIRPEADAGDFKVPDLGGQEQSIPFRPEELDAKKKPEKFVDTGTKERIEAAKQENAQLNAIAKARADGLIAKEIELLARRQGIEKEFSDARLIVNDEERALALENLALKHNQELAEIVQQSELIALQKEEEQAARAELDAELREEEIENRELISEEDLTALSAKLLTEDAVRTQFAKTDAERVVAERNKFLKDEVKHGTTVATLNKFFASEEVTQAKSAASALIGLTNSKNSTLKGIGKAAARVQAAIATGEGAIKAYSSLAGIPIVGPVLGAIAATAVIAFGVEQQANISAAATGGFVPPAQGGSRDRVPTLLEPNELVVPSALAPNFIQAAGLPDTQGREAVGDQGDAGGSMELILSDRAAENFTLEQREGETLGTIGASNGN